jgi:hypothetical protein
VSIPEEAAPMTEHGRFESDSRHRPKKVASASEDWKRFSDGFDRCFGRVYAYVSRRATDPRSREHIVSEVLASNLDLIVDRIDELQEVRRLKAASDQLIRSQSVRARSGGEARRRG